jgi:hypothetical protein
MDVSSPNASGERGASLLEFAIVAPLLFALLFGIATAGLTYSSKQSLNGAAREAARFAATLPVDGDMNTWLNDVADVALSAATGELDNGVEGRGVCVAFVHPDGTTIDDQTTRLTIDALGTRTITAGSTCLIEGRPSDERRAQVEVSKAASIEAIIYSHDLALTSRSVVRFERPQE